MIDVPRWHRQYVNRFRDAAMPAFFDTPDISFWVCAHCRRNYRRDAARIRGSYAGASIASLSLLPAEEGRFE